MTLRPLLLTFVALLGVAIWVTWSEKAPDHDDAAGDVNQLFPHSTMESVQVISWFEGDRVLRIQRDKQGGPSWFVAGEVQRLASEAHVLAAIRSVTTLQARRSFQPEGPLSGYGLSTLSPRIRLDGAEGLLAEITLGSAAPLSAGRYVETASSETIYMVGQDLLEPALRDPKDFLDMRVLGIAPRDIAHVEIVRESESPITIERSEDGGFQASTSKTSRHRLIENDTVSDLLFALAELRGTRVAEQREQPGGTDSPSWTVNLRSIEGDEATLLLGRADPEGDLFALASGSALPRGVGDELLLVPAAIREQLVNTRETSATVEVRP